MRFEKWLAFAFVCLVLASCSREGGKGDEGPNGGDRVAQQAASLAMEVVSQVSKLPQLFPEVPIDSLREAARRARIIVREKTFANGVETDATNNGSDLIELNGSRWETIVDYDRRLALIFHELLGLIGLERNSYAISSRLLSLENRFSEERIYHCQQGSLVCRITMRYDRTMSAFVARDGDCGHFASRNNVYRKSGNGSYSTHSYCTPPVDGQPSSCSQQPGTGIEWDSLTLMDGLEFFFRGYYRDELHCFFDTNAPFTVSGQNCYDIWQVAERLCKERAYGSYKEASECRRGPNGAWSREFTCQN